MKTTIRLTVSDAAKARGITTAYQLQKAMGCMPATAARLFKGDVIKVEFSTLAKVMDVLSRYPEKRPKRCTLGDLLKVEQIEDES